MKLVRINLFLVFFSFIFILPSNAAETFQLINGDRISGDFVKETASAIILNTASMGQIELNKAYIQVDSIQKPEAKRLWGWQWPEYWSGKASAGFSGTRGNTETTSVNASVALKRKIEKKNEFDIKMSLSGQDEEGVTISQKADGLVRYAWSFGPSKKWYNYYSVEVDHDRFANIRVRLVPQVGLGYWFWDTDDIKLMTEAGLGVQYTKFREPDESETELIAIPRAYFEKRLFKDSTFSQEAIAYPSLTELGEYRLHLETAFTNPISDELALKVSWINDFNSNPGPDIKKHDMEWLLSLEYSF